MKAIHFAYCFCGNFQQGILTYGFYVDEVPDLNLDKDIMKFSVKPLGVKHAPFFEGSQIHTCLHLCGAEIWH